MNAGDTFYLYGDPHLWVIVSDPAQDPDQVILVHFSTHESWRDTACKFKGGEHPKIVHPTIVAYDRAEMVTVTTLANLIQAGKASPQIPLSPDALKKICQCSYQSRLKRDWVHLLIEQKMIDVKKIAPPAT